MNNTLMYGSLCFKIHIWTSVQLLNTQKDVIKSNLTLSTWDLTLSTFDLSLSTWDLTSSTWVLKPGNMPKHKQAGASFEIIH